MTDPVAAKIIDDLLCLWAFRGADPSMDHTTATQGIMYLLTAMREHPEFRVTVSLFQEMGRRGMLV